MTMYSTKGLINYQICEHNESKSKELVMDCEDINDGYHTMNELYEHRYALFAALVKVYDGYKTPLGCNVTCYKSKLHHDGTMPDGWFIVMMIVNPIMVGKPTQISYHLPISWWDKFNIMPLERMWEWDGHTSNDVLKRLLEL